MIEPLVSVLVATYNHEEYIARAIEGILEQKTDFPFEVIIGEDCSKDRTREIVFRYQKQHPELIQVITSDQNVGMVENDKRIEKKARGKYLAFCEGDDYWCDPLKLQKQVEILESDPTISMCFHAVKFEFINSRKRDRIKRYYRKSRYAPVKGVIFKEGDFYKVVSAVFRQSIFNSPPDWYKQSPSYDYSISLLAALRGSVYYLDEVMAVYCIGAQGSWTMNFTGDLAFHKDHILQKIALKNEADRETNFSQHRLFRRRTRINVMDIRLSGVLLKDEIRKLEEENDHNLSVLDHMVIRIIDLLHLNKLWLIYAKIRNRLLLS